MRSTQLKAGVWLLSLLISLSFVACSVDQPITDETTAPSAQTTASEPSESGTEAATDTAEETAPLIPAPTVTENGDTATVQTAQGLTYTVKNYSAIANGSFTFEKGLEMTFDPADFTESFNRFTLTYKASAPVKLSMTYTMRGTDEQIDHFYLEAGEGSFSGLISQYLKRLSGTEISSITVDTCQSEPATFVLCALSTEKIDIYTTSRDDTTCYIQNDRYKLGIDLGWGGAVVYLADLQSPVDGLENLINRHDTGRLIQQSFYGTPPIPGVYETDIYNGSQWVYNPVQGGDRHNNSSRLIDVRVTDTSIYIKAQPQDWSLDDVLTPSYMENTYILDGEFVRVDNRFVDFSGWEHPHAGQELPALYTVSYLDTFVWYDGKNPWNGDKLTSRNDLPFWGAAEHAGNCQFRLRASNTETWCAWINQSADYGIGLYVPKVDILKAGRYEYDGSKSDAANSCSYVAPINTMQMISYVPITYSYLLTTGTLNGIRSSFTEHRDFVTNDSLHENYLPSRIPDITVDMSHIDFTQPDNWQLLLYGKTAEAAYDVATGATKLTVTGSDPFLYYDFALSDRELYAEDHLQVEIEYMIPTTNSQQNYTAELFYCAGSISDATGGVSLGSSLRTDGGWHTMTFDLGGKDTWTGKIHKLRFDFFNTASNAGDVMYIKSFKLIKGTYTPPSAPVYAHPNSLDFSNPHNLALFENLSDTTVAFDEAAGTAHLTSINGTDPNVTICYANLAPVMQAEDYGTLKITYMIPATTTLQKPEIDLFLCAGAITAPSGDVLIRKPLVADGQFHTLEVTLSDKAFWNGQINAIRIDYFADCAAGEQFLIRSVELTD